MFKIERVLLGIVIITALILRIYGLNWDNGYHLHPDERMLIMVTEKIDLFQNLNPNFFNYGSLPIYLLRLFSPDGNYDTLLSGGRKLSIFFDLLTIFYIFKISRFLFKSNKISILSSFIYAIAFFPIQNSHFFVVDVFLTTFTTILFYLLLSFWQGQRSRPESMALFGITFAAMLATKFTAIIFYPVIISVIFWKSVKKFRNLIFSLFTFHLSLFTFHFLFMPYAYLDYPKFITDIKLQLQMNSNPYIFPYTLQYVGTLPYLYYLKNVFLWGLGPLISILSLIGIYQILKNKYQKSLLSPNTYLLTVFFIFYLFYFIIVGRSAVKFMRYILPMYPFFVISAGYGLSRLSKAFRFLFLLVSTLWTVMFITIYFRPHTRIAATEWILKNIPAGSTIAVEHWDDRLPISGSNNYHFEELTLYDQPDDDSKWRILNDKLQKSDYLIIASNRLYTPLQKLSDCRKYQKCYPKTAEYYKKLLGNELSFQKITEFFSYPKLEIGKWKLEIRDDVADESFTVYDHPKIMIFKKSH